MSRKIFYSLKIILRVKRAHIFKESSLPARRLPVSNIAQDVDFAGFTTIKNLLISSPFARYSIELLKETLSVPTCRESS